MLVEKFASFSAKETKKHENQHIKIEHGKTKFNYLNSQKTVKWTIPRYKSGFYLHFPKPSERRSSKRKGVDVEMHIMSFPFRALMKFPPPASQSCLQTCSVLHSDSHFAKRQSILL